MTPAPETQPERTALAWQRTGLGVLAVAGLLGHAALSTGGLPLVLLAGVVALLGLTVLVRLAPQRYRQVRRAVAAGDGVAAPRPIAAVTGLVLGAASVALVAVPVILLRR